MKYLPAVCRRRDNLKDCQRRYQMVDASIWYRFIEL